MKFENIPFTTRNGANGKMLGLRLNGRNWVPKDRCEQMWDRATEVLPLLDWSVPRTTSSFFETEQWKKLRAGQTQALGRCLRYFAEREMLPIYCINPEKSGTKRYAVIWPKLVLTQEALQPSTNPLQNPGCNP